MELTEPIESINQQLIDLFGIDTITGQPMFRVIWAADQYEKRLSKYTLEGLELIHPEIQLLPKYDQRDLDYKERYILERLVLVPEVNQNEIATKLSYEPLWVFRDRFNNYLPPTLWASKFAIDCVYAAMGKCSLAKYKHPEKNQETSLQLQKERVDKLEEELFGDESMLLGRTITGEAVGYTGEKKES
jgi:hypothetical protein